MYTKSWRRPIPAFRHQPPAPPPPPSAPDHIWFMHWKLQLLFPIFRRRGADGAVILRIDFGRN